MHLIKYQLNQEHQYWVPPAKVSELEAPQPAQSKAEVKAPPGPKTARKAVRPAPAAGRHESCSSAEAICVYTDGACSGNPGPAGVGVVLRYQGHQKEISRYIGMGTNNRAELEAIRTGLLAVKNRNLPVVVFTDSRYAWGLLTQGWKAKQNQELVEEIRAIMTHFVNLRFVKVKGHAGHPENERADRMAVAAIENRQNSGKNGG
jgi:ribonuclease HI